MRVYVIRHAAAEPGAGEGDAGRRLTEDGAMRMKRVAKALARIGICPDKVYTSPLVRARQTAEIVAKALGKEEALEDCQALAPGRAPKEVIEFLKDHPAEEVAIVGHEPQLGDLVALAVTNAAKAVVDMKKAAVACVQFDGAPAAGKGVLLWHLIPAVVESLAAK